MSRIADLVTRTAGLLPVLAARGAQAAGDLYRSGVAASQEQRRLLALRGRSDTLGIPPEWYESIAREFGEEPLIATAMEKAAERDEARHPWAKAWQGLTEDPFEPVASWGGWRERPTMLSYELMELLSRRLGPFAGYMQTRLNQMSVFSQKQEEHHGLGLVVQKKGATKGEKKKDKRAEELTKIIMASGTTDQYDEQAGARREGFRTVLRKLLRDTLLFDQINIEKRRDAKGRLVEWRTLDPKTIRRVSPWYEGKNWFGEPIRYVQVMSGTVAADFSHKDLTFFVRNPRSDIRAYGYGFSELEMAISTITALLNGFDHNSRYFCASGDTRVATRSGLEQIEDLAGREFEIWNGAAWKKARAVETGTRPLVRTRLWNGLELKTSPEHRFLVLPKDGTSLVPTWKEQKDLVSGDHALVGEGGVDAPLDPSRLFVGKVYPGRGSRGRDFTVTKELVEDPEFWEMLGFALGDGHWPTMGVGTDRGGSIGIFPHHTKDAFLLPRFIAVCERHGIHAIQSTQNHHLVRVTDGVSGYPCVRISHKAFVQWLYELGFYPSAKGKRVADAVFSLPIVLRCAMLRGWFSADGYTHTHATGYRTPTVFSEDARLRQDAVLLLWSCGVAANNVGKGWKRCGKVVVQNSGAFVEKIGFLQDYKNTGIKRSPISEHRWDKLHPGASAAIAQVIAAAPMWLSLSLADRGFISRVRQGGRCLSRPRAIRMLQELGVPVPGALLYHHIPVDVIDTKPLREELMFDVEVFDDEHIFLGNMVAIHNSQGTTAKGLLAIHGLVPPNKLRIFKQLWYNMVTGAGNAWRTPVLNLYDAQSKVEWIDLQKSNLDMEWSRFMEWCLKVLCSVLQIAPEEIGFQMGNQGQKSTMNEGNQGEKIDASKDRGLPPLIDAIEVLLNEEIMEELDPEYEIKFAGLDQRTEQAEVELLVKEAGNYKTVDEVRAARDLSPLENDDGKVILNPTWLQYHQQAQQAQMMQQQQGAGGQPPDMSGFMGQQEQPEQPPEQGGYGDLLQPGLKKARIIRERFLVDV